MKTAEIRDTYLNFFTERGHRLEPSASLIPPPEDKSTLLTIAGMQPFKPYLSGQVEPPSPRICSVQRCFRTPDIEEVGKTKRHLTFFEMLGNWSFGDYFKEESIAWGWELSVEAFGFDPDLIWVSVFEGDEELGLGPDEESIEIWRSIGVPEERIVRLPRSENYWQAGLTGPSGPSSEMYLDRGEDFGGPNDRPGDDTDRFLEYWNHVFMSYELHEDGSVSPLPKNNVDTGMGLERMAAILQDVPSVFETDGFRPLVQLAEELSGATYGDDEKSTRAMRILADHCRGTVNLIADGVVPSNEDRGYVLRRIMRRAIQQGRVLGLEGDYMEQFAERAIETLAEVYPHLGSERDTVMRWVRDESQSFGRTLERGTELLNRLVAEARDAGTSWIDAEDAFRLHDTYGFPYDLTKELLAEEGLAVDDEGFEALMEKQRVRARTGAEPIVKDRHEAVLSFVSENPRTEFVGYQELSAQTSVAAARPLDGDGEVLVKLEESPFYAEGGGQVADSGVVSWDGGEARVADVYRVGDDQAIRIGPASGEVEGTGVALDPGQVVTARVNHLARHATMRNHTATHLLHAALRERLGTHVRQAGSAVRPDKLRFDFTHGAPLAVEEVRAIEDRVNEWVKASRPVRALEMGRAEAEALGAMALFGEKYGDWVRVIEVDEVSRELCGGTHVHNTGEVGIFAIVSEGSSAANVRRIEALTGPAAIDHFRSRSDDLAAAGALLGSERDPLAAARRAAERLAELERRVAELGRKEAGEEAEALVAGAEEVAGIKVVAARAHGADQRELLNLADRVKQKLGEAAVVLGGADNGKVALVAGFTPGAIERGLSAASIVREAAAVVGGGGGGRDDAAQAGGREPEKLEEALEAARAAIRAALGG
ncbi:MAG TPA: alanine--tRNA ligase [Solirubrobacterales bacterium]|nr:alanine--tRNA ligase [Solirubrobacterales bacterium]